MSRNGTTDLTREEFIGILIDGNKLSIDLIRNFISSKPIDEIKEKIGKYRIDNIYDENIKEKYETTNGLCEGIQIERDPLVDACYIINHNTK